MLICALNAVKGMVIKMKVLSFGEILWDIYPDGKHLGGAPLNFAAHFVKQGGNAGIISSVGNDELGKLALFEIKKLGVNTEYISVLQKPETGKCIVTLDSHGIPKYNLLNDVAYDYISIPDLCYNEDFVNAFYFGTLALRNKKNRETLAEILKNNSFDDVFVDVNIRPPFISVEALELTFNNASLIKISDEELSFITNIFFNATYNYETAAKIIRKRFNNIKIIIITLGENGSYAYDCKEEKEYRCNAKKVNVVSTVGAGDSFSATFLINYLSGFTIDICLKKASEISALVVSKAEAIPDY